MPEAPAILARLDAIMRELAEPRSEVAAAELQPNFVAAIPDADSDFSPEHLIEITTAVDRFNRPADSLRWMCRKQGLGVKRAGRWLASAPRLARYLNGK